MPERLLLLFVLTFIPTARVCGTSDIVWWEGERPVETTFPDSSWFSARESEQQHLSGGAWLTAEGDRGGLSPYAIYEVNVPEADTYDFWVRKFWLHGPFRWRFQGQPWRECGRDIALVDHTDLRTHVCANWVHLGEVQLAAGPHQLRIELTVPQGESMVSGFDCFVLARDGFVPNGPHRPGVRTGLADPGFFAFEPDHDPFTDDALLDLRELNEAVAGQDGFVTCDARGEFRLGSGTPVRFWAVNIKDENAAAPRRSVDYLARRLAKLGVNMVRYHSPLFTDSDDPTVLDAKRLDDLMYFIAAMKREGIYTTVSFYFPLWFDIESGYGIPGYNEIESKKPFGLVYFNPRMREIHRAWLTELLTTRNPYSNGILADEPALALIELVNEDSLLFWTFKPDNVPERHWSTWERVFGHWLKGRYGSVDRALEAWKGESHERDDLGSVRVALYDPWHLTTDGLNHGGSGKRLRAADQVRFLTEVQRSFYEGAAKFVREDLGYGGLIVASNWKVSDPELFDALERYTYTAADVIDRHAYFYGEHEGEGASYSVREGHRYTDAALVRAPERNPVQAAQVAGQPQIISELAWSNPNRYRADATLISAAYASLQGIDGLYFFALDSNYVRDTSIGKQSVGTPVMAGTFPAAALMYRRGDVATAAPVVLDVLDLEKLYALEGSQGAAAPAFDEMRRRDGGSPRSGFDPRTFCVGPVQRAFDVDYDPIARDVSPFIDDERKVIRSATDELVWDSGRGLVTVDTPRCAGATGFMRDVGDVRIGDVQIDVRNEYASIFVISLDGAPLTASKRMLVQTMTEEQLYGFRAEGGLIRTLGSAPFNVRHIDASISLPGPIARVTALDECGYARSVPVGLQADGDRTRVTLHRASIYHIIERD